MNGIGTFLLGPGNFRTQDEIKEIVRTDPRFDHSAELFQDLGALLIFKTSTQQTWLVASNMRLYCVLDDIKNRFTQLQWALPRGELVSPAGQLVVHIRWRDRSASVGLLDIGKHAGWLYSKRLFDEPPDKRISELIQKAMTP